MPPSIVTVRYEYLTESIDDTGPENSFSNIMIIIDDYDCCLENKKVCD